MSLYKDTQPHEYQRYSSIVKALVYVQAKRTGMNEVTVNSNVWMGEISTAIFSGKENFLGEIRWVFIMKFSDH